MTPIDPQEFDYLGMPPEEPALEEVAEAAPLPQVRKGDLYPLIGEQELKMIADHIDDCLQSAAEDHGVRCDNMMRIYSIFRRLTDAVEPGEEDSSRISVPLVQWSVFDQAAKEFHAMFGEGASIVGEPANPDTSSEMSKKVGQFMRALVLKRMQITKDLMEFLTYRALFGRAFAYRGWVKEEDDWIGDDGIVTRKVFYEGPSFKVLAPWDVMHPTQRDVRSIQKFSWRAVRRRYKVEDLIRLEMAGEFHGVLENLNDFYRVAGSHDNQDWSASELNEIKDVADGVESDQRNDPSGEVLVYEWIGKRCLPKPEFMAADEAVEDEDFENRELLPQLLTVHWVPALHRIIGVDDQVEAYPRMRNRVPIWESALAYGDGYYRPGLGDLLLDLERDLTSNERQFTDTVRTASMGFGVHEPGSGLGSDSIAMVPGESQPVADVNKFKWIQMNANFDAFVLKKQSVLELVERINVQSDFSMGRGMDRPTQPRTATGQSLLIQAGSVRINVSLVHFNEDLSQLLNDYWQMWVSLGDPEEVFRVTESNELAGQLDMTDGRAKLTPKERNGNYTFSFRFAASEVDKAIEQQNAIQAYTIGSMNPLIATNPAAMWELTKSAMDSLGQKWFTTKVPRPIAIGAPKDPNVEWAMMLNGEEVEPHIDDDDQRHYIEHQKQYRNMLRKDDEQDADAIARLETHLLQTVDQIQAKIQQQAMMDTAAQAMMIGAAQGEQPGGSKTPPKQ